MGQATCPQCGFLQGYQSSSEEMECIQCGAVIKLRKRRRPKADAGPRQDASAKRSDHSSNPLSHRGVVFAGIAFVVAAMLIMYGLWRMMSGVVPVDAVAAQESEDDAAAAGEADKEDAMRVGTTFATKLARDGYTIGPGGNILHITAGYQMVLASGGRNMPLHFMNGGKQGKRAEVPRVTWTLTTTDAAGNYVIATYAIGNFPGRMSKYYRGQERKRNLQFPGEVIQYEWESPGDVTEAILAEIMERGIGLLSFQADRDRYNTASASFLLDWHE
ncbi:unnamed protein product [Durusdinium trenchii]|uniref:Uncharacterized protein n=1 Tax=Durusdinium trenchii TaxID=1381693 RepID=A0ABP0KUQ7_9DINO